MKQWEVYISREKIEGYRHPFVVISNDERCRNSHYEQVNVLLCSSLRPGTPLKLTEVRLDERDGFDHPTACQCEFFYVLEKTDVQKAELIGEVITVNRPTIWRKVKDCLRMTFQ